eukprot:TRINITY_DN31157_c0_g1_i1.p2 TRINITY_DN31157_c0_g1~~TRINITY_DN31157_c0_g1_i1.p2  ORF type:complete len:154 (-),score=39.52 TRINITY_DN31157_c0_g1_i1:101-562(-)
MRASKGEKLLDSNLDSALTRKGDTPTPTPADEHQFEILDKDGNDYIDKSELERFFGTICAEDDADGDERLSLEEFKDFTAVANLSPEKFLDKNCDHRINEEEAVSYVKKRLNFVGADYDKSVQDALDKINYAQPVGKTLLRIQEIVNKAVDAK